MAMLAGPRKRKRYNLVPRGKALYEDEDRFGTKMLEKMGWSKGKGLGAKEDGAKDFVRVRYKNDAEGLGFEERDDQWTQHEESFDGLLKTLNGNEGDGGNETDDAEVKTVGFGFATKEKKLKLKDKISGHSLEEKSKMSKARVHYKKFTRGKDLSRYSEKDLANIFGKKSVDEIEEEEGAQSLGLVIGKPLEKEVVQQENSTGDPYINAGISVSDYFKQKMEAKKRLLKGETNETDDAEKEAETPKKKQKKAKNLKVSESASLNGIEEHPNEIKEKAKNNKVKVAAETITSEPKNNKKKEKQKAEEVKLKDPAEALNLKEYTAESKKAQKKKEKLIFKEEKLEDPEEMTLNENHSELKKKKKKEKIKAKEVQLKNPAEAITLDENPPQPKKKKKKEKLKAKDVEARLTETAADEKPAENSVPKQKRAKNPKLEKITNKQQHENAPVQVNLEEEAPKKKKGKKKKFAELVEQTSQICIDVEPSKLETNIEPVVQETQTDESKKNTNENETTAETSAVPASPQPSAPTANPSAADPEDPNVYTISSFCAEKFRNVDLDQFFGSNLADITGYGMTEDVKLEVKVIKGDEERITQLWNCTGGKYSNADPKQSYHRYIKQVKAAKKAKQKLPNMHVKTWKRKNAFQGLE